MLHSIFKIFQVGANIAVCSNNDLNSRTYRKIAGILLMGRIGDIGVRNHGTTIIKFDFNIGRNIRIGHKFPFIEIRLDRVPVFRRDTKCIPDTFAPGIQAKNKPRIFGRSAIMMGIDAE
eukprot:NODE_13156_length_437_cov_1.596774_g13133_i0.p2 GENE.NODE_13156_length_437_cov_1.596774_g13133_i0~~NODE_13156_length_437_cov_1.596774_g13133_i0.p2  ORF type:complete len:119 (-),score=9.47 NODE_13156_length_437_cov_1.596774_g13133_i0:79-435(-)